MLILTRRKGETLIIGESVKVTVVGLQGNSVRLGIEAPKDIPVHRKEVYRRIQHEKAQGLTPEASRGARSPPPHR